MRVSVFVGERVMSECRIRRNHRTVDIREMEQGERK